MGKLIAAEKVLKTIDINPPVESRPEVQQAVVAVQNVRKQLRTRSWRPQRVNRAAWLQNLAVGDSVRVQGFPGTARVIADPDDRGMVEVSVGSLRAQVPLDRVMHLDYQEPSAERATVKRKQKSHGPSQVDVEHPDHVAVKGRLIELDLRGVRVVEALGQLETFLDKALLDGASQVRVIHGMGTGALRSAVRERLGSHTIINRWAPEEGRTADGATIADLA